MPIKLKKSNIQFDVDNPDEGYMVLGFDEQGRLVYKDSNGDYDTIIPTVPTANFVKLNTDYFTIGYRLSGQFEGLYSYAQGESAISSGYTSMTQGKSVISQGDYSLSRGEYTQSIGTYSFSSGKGASNSSKLISGGLNTFVHSFATSPSATYGDYSVILGGTNHNIAIGGNNSIILGGNNNTISTNVNNSSIIACDTQTSSVDYTVHVPRLVLVNGTYATPPDGTVFYDGINIMARLSGSDVSLSVQTTGLVTAVTASSPLTSSGTTTPNISILSATGSRDGYLTSGDWTTFNNKVTSVSASGALSSSGGVTPAITHSTLAGYKHIPTAGSSNQYLKYSSSGTAVWSNLPAGGTVTSVSSTSSQLNVANGTTTPSLSLDIISSVTNGSSYLVTSNSIYDFVNGSSSMSIAGTPASGLAVGSIGAKKVGKVQMVAGQVIVSSSSASFRYFKTISGYISPGFTVYFPMTSHSTAGGADGYINTSGQIYVYANITGTFYFNASIIGS
jgi:hypothetical protein